MSLAQYQIIDGDSLELVLTTGHEMRADWKDGAADDGVRDRDRRQ